MTESGSGAPGQDPANAALAGEHAAIYAYGAVGAHLPDLEQPWAVASMAAHRRRRDGLSAAVVRTGGSPVAAEPAYALPNPVADRAAALRLAVLVEERLATLYLALILGRPDPGWRTLASAAVQAGAVGAATWRLRAGATPVMVAFPGR